jgi:hypothetical protein
MHKSPPPRKNLLMSEIPIVQPERRKAKTSSPQGKQVRLNLVYVDVWSAVKVSSLVSLAVSITVFLVVILSWLLLNTVGVIDALEGIVGDILGDGGGAILALLSFSQVTLLAFVGALINLVSLTVLGSLGAVLYNAIARLTGGLRVGFTNT